MTPSENPTRLEVRPDRNGTRRRDRPAGALPASGFVRDLDRQVRQLREAAETASIVVRLPPLRGCDRDDRSEVPRPQTPEVQVGDLVALGLDGLAQLAGHVPVGVHVEQDRAAAWLATNFPRRARNPDSRVTESIARRGARGPASRCTGRVREDGGGPLFDARGG